MQSTAICVFVKTPELSPVKTRLAASIGASAAILFYEKAVEEVKNTITNFSSLHSLHDLSHVSPYWAVAEESGLKNPRWSEWPQLWQGEGDLGERLAHIEAQAFEAHDSVLFLGADAPQITEADFSKAYELLRHNDVVVGPCTDGGFYLLLTNKPLGKEIWTSVTYSADTTLAELKSYISKQKPQLKYIELTEKFDVDTVDEYNRLCQLHPKFLVT